MEESKLYKFEIIDVFCIKIYL